MTNYLPPPAQAHAQPAHAQAHAQDRPPPLEPPPELRYVEGGGGGLVTLVTPLVNPVNPPRTLDEKVETLLTTDAANVEPGMVGIEGIEIVLPPAEGMAGGIALPTEVVLGRALVGS